MLKIGDFVDFVEPDLPSSVPAEPKRWFLVRVHPLIERRVQRKLTERGISCYVPQYPKLIMVKPRFAWQDPVERRRIVPLFPGIVFVPDFDADIPRLRGLADGVVGFLHLGDQRAALTSQLMADVRAIEAEQCTPLAQKKQRVGRLRVGAKVRIRDGSPFAMWTGRIERLDDRGRLRVLIDVIKREVPVNVFGHQVEPVEQATVC